MKKASLLLVAVFLLCCLCTEVFSHPGRTDANGGHTDHSTGKYHYHHGYSAHQHYDMDGDGKADCPYDFKGKAVQNSGSSNNSSSSSYIAQIPTYKITSPSTVPTAPVAVAEQQITNSKSAKVESDKMTPDFSMFLFIAILFVLITILVLLNKINDLKNDLANLAVKASEERNKLEKKIKEIENENEYLNEELSRWQYRENELYKKGKTLEKQREDLQRKEEDLRKLYLDQISFTQHNLDRKMVLKIAGADEGDMLNEQGQPIASKYWFYYRDIGYGLKRYHTKDCVHRANCKLINAVEIRRNQYQFTPCQHCMPWLPNTEWVDIALSYIEFQNLAEIEYKSICQEKRLLLDEVVVK